MTKLHDEEILHGDPRPSNFLICNDGANGRAIILDFGFPISDLYTSDDDMRKLKKSFKIK